MTMLDEAQVAARLSYLRCIQDKKMSHDFLDVLLLPQITLDASKIKKMSRNASS